MKLLRVFVFVSVIGLIIASLASGLQLSTSIGGNDGSSSMNVRYGATIDDYNYEHIQLNPTDNTLSNAFSGSGSLPSGSISISDTKGNYAQAYRSISGKSGTTKWNYDWNTYKPTSSAGSGVGAWVSLTASNAYSISGGSYASNGEGDNAQANTNINSNSLLTSTLSNYYTSASAFTNAATAYQTADSAVGSSIIMGPVAKNKEGDQAWDTITVTGGSLSTYSDSASAASRTSAISQNINSASGSSVQVGPVAKNSEGDQAWGLISGGSLSGYTGYGTISSASAITTQYLKSLSGSSVQAGPAAKNSEGDQAWDITTLTSGSLIGYSDSASAALKTASSTQNIDSTSGSSIKAGSVAQNTEGDLSYANINSAKGVLSGYSVKTDTAKTTAKTNPKASTISITGTSDVLYASASNSLGENSNFNLYVINGVVTNPNFYAWSQTHSGETNLVSLTSAYGASAEIKSHAENLALAQDPNSPGVYHAGGSADFEALNTNGIKFTNPTVDSTATGSLVTIASTGFTKTALLLEPFKWEFGDIYSPVGSKLEQKGYAVTDYSNAGVTWDKVYKLDESTVSVIYTHGVVDSTKTNPNTLGLAISYSGAGWETWTQLQPYLTTPNGMIILNACDPFNTNSYTTTFNDGTKTTTPGKYTVSKAQVSGGYVGSAYYPTSVTFLDTLFTRLAAGDTISAANTAAASSVKNVQKLTLQGNTAYKLQ